MAGHLIVKNTENIETVTLFSQFIISQKVKKMKPFLRYDKNVKLITPEDYKDGIKVYQKLTDRNEKDDKLVLSIYPLTMYYDGEPMEDAIAEIHQKKNGSVQIYAVL